MSKRDERRIYEVKLTEEQFRYLWDRFPYDEELISQACREAYWKVRVPNMTGVWRRFGARVYKDEYGFNTSGYRMVHWDDHAKVPGCLSNGYVSDPEMSRKLYDDSEIDWDPEVKAWQDKALAVREMLAEWM